MLKLYYELTKPGIVYGNLITVIAGFLLASKSNVDYRLLALTLAGIGLVMASGCVVNNYIDRDIDMLMERTRRRALARGAILPKHALAFGAILAFLGTSILFFSTNMLATSIALFGLFAYVVLYSLWTKRTTVYGTLVGSVAGAVPPVVGYTTVTHMLDIDALIIFATLVFWQMAHSYAIAIYLLKDYANAKIPVLPVKKGVLVAKIDMIIYVILTVIAMLAFVVFANAGLIYGVLVGISGFVWLSLAVRGLYAPSDEIWAKRMLLASIMMIVLWSFELSLASVGIFRI